MEMQRLLRQGRIMFPEKDAIDRPASCRYTPSASAVASRWSKHCHCFPAKRNVDVPARLRVVPPLDDLTVLVAQRRYATYTDFLHNEVDSRGIVPLTHFRK